MGEGREGGRCLCVEGGDGGDGGDGGNGGDSGDGADGGADGNGDVVVTMVWW